MQTALVASITEPHCEMAWESACEFHGLQYVQLFADQKFPQASAFDATLRWNQHRFSFGSGRIVARGVAKHLGLDWKIPLAPRSDGFKVTTASRHCITRFAELYQILIAALEIELHATYMATRSIAWKSYNQRLDQWQKQDDVKPTGRPRPPSAAVGFNVKEARLLRAQGARMLAPGLLIFGFGRANLLDKHLAAYATFTQKFAVSSLVKVAAQHDLILSMRASVHGLCALAAVLRLLLVAMDRRSGGRTLVKDDSTGAGNLYRFSVQLTT